MKRRKQNLLSALVILLTFFSVAVIAQSRENRENAEFDEKSEKLKSATGWALNGETGKWVENANVIYDRKCEKYWKSHTTNFKWIQFATVKYNGKEYYVFLYEGLTGSYRYPNIKQDWETGKITGFSIFDSTDYTDLKEKIALKNGDNIILTSKIHGYITDRFKILGGEHSYNEKNLLAKITTAINEGTYYEESFILNSQNVDGQDVVRFRLPGQSGQYIEGAFKKAYFETPLEDFQKILF